MLFVLLKVLNISMTGMIEKLFAELDRPLNAPVKREILVVFARGVAIRCRAGSRRDRLSSSCLHAEVSFKSPTHLDKREEVELVTDVAIGVRVVETEGCNEIKRAIGKWIAFIRIVVLIFRKRVVPLKLISSC